MINCSLLNKINDQEVVYCDHVVFQGNNCGKRQKLGEEVDAAHVEHYVVPYEINFDQPSSKCR